MQHSKEGLKGNKYIACDKTYLTRRDTENKTRYSYLQRL